MIEFKSNSKYFYDEQAGMKPWTIRKIDNNDGIFISLLSMMENKKFTEDIKIVHVEVPSNYFIRQIKHICTWEGFICVTWRA